MKALSRQLLQLCLVAAIALLVSRSARAEVFISEILFNPPGTDSPNEYIELRGTPNLVLPAGTWLLTLEGDAAADPGTVQNIFDLSGRRIGGNGFLVLLQKNTPYTPDANTTVLVNTNSGAGWGSGAGSSVGHRGRNGLTDLKNPSVTFFLIQTTNPPGVGDDLDGNNNGTLARNVVTNWTVLDSVGVLDGDGAGDIAYGAVNFRLGSLPGNAAQASGVVVPVGFVPKYVARAGSGTGATGSDWVAADGLSGSAPNWTLGNLTNTFPGTLADAPLTHLGAPNFGAPAFPGVVLTETAGTTLVSESAGTAAYTLGLNTPSSGPITIQ
ncbi:MAG TPA: hypothetical protein VNZ22_23360, partial [Bacillota bacterium]|nr:hypothetical protein [Bacillota bacterium]